MANPNATSPLWRPPMAFPPARTSKTKNKCPGCHTFFSEISRPCAPYIRLRLRVFFDFDYFDYGFSPKMVITTALTDFEFFCFEDLPDMLGRCRRAQIKDKHPNLNLETSPAWIWSLQPCIMLHRFLTHWMASAFNKFRVFLFWGPSRYARKV